MLSPGFLCRKSLKTAACFHTSSSSLPSITGGLSKRGTRTGFAFSGGTTTTCLPAPDFGMGDGDGVGVCAATGRDSNASEPSRTIRFFAAIKANRPTKSDFSLRLVWLGGGSGHSALMLSTQEDAAWRPCVNKSFVLTRERDLVPKLRASRNSCG